MLKEGTFRTHSLEAVDVAMNIHNRAEAVEMINRSACLVVGDMVEAQVVVVLSYHIGIGTAD